MPEVIITNLPSSTPAMADEPLLDSGHHITCDVCGTIDTYDDAAWVAHCAHLPASGGFDADDFDDDE